MFCAACGAKVAEGAAFCASCGRPTTGIGAGTSTVANPSEALGGGAAVYVQPEIDGNYAGFWLRVVAAFIDGAVMLIGLGILFGIRVATIGFPRFEMARRGMYGPMMGPLRVFQLSAAVAAWLYFALMESSAWQATLGKKALGLYVTDLHGRRVSFGRATGRHFAKLISNFTLLIGYLMAGFTAKKQALHDMIAGCLVMKKA
jgi:uncharacterized RDD family membrane protein YckC